VDQITPVKPVREDWRIFNEAVTARAAYLKGLVVPPAPPATAAAPADWLRRGAGIGSVVLAAGAAAALILWILRPPAHSFGDVPSLPPSMPAAKITVDYTKFVTIVLDGREVVTGWKYASNEDPQPNHQYCYLSIARTGSTSAQHLTTELRQLRRSEGVSLRIDLADTAAGLRRYDADAMAPLTLVEFRAASLNCIWAPGTTLPPPLPVT
jgi:hypothetical protein